MCGALPRRLVSTIPSNRPPTSSLSAGLSSISLSSSTLICWMRTTGAKLQVAQQRMVNDWLQGLQPRGL